MALKDKKLYHNIDLLKNYIKNALVTAGTEDESIVNLKQLVDSFKYDTVKASAIKNIYTTVGGLQKGTDVSGKTLKDLFDLMFFTTSGVDYSLPMVVNGIVNIKVGGVVIKSVPFGTSADLTEFVDYDGDVTVELIFNYIKNDGGDINGISINGITLIDDLGTLDANGYVNIEYPLKTVIPTISSPKTISVAVSYAAGEQKYDEQGEPSGIPIPSGTISINNILTFLNLAYPVFFKNYPNVGVFVSSTFNYQTDATGYLTKTNFASVNAGNLLVIGIPVQSGAGLTVLEKSINASDRFIRREISISSSKQASAIPYRLYYFFANENETDFIIGQGSDNSKLGTSDAYSWIGVEHSLSCVNKGFSDQAVYSLAEKLFGGQKTGYIVENTNQVPATQVSSCLVNPIKKLKLADISLTRYSTLDALYAAVGNIADAETQLNSSEAIIKSGALAYKENGQPVTNKGFALFKTAYGFAVLGIATDDSYTIHQFPKASNSAEDWRILSSSGTCERLIGIGTGYFVYSTLELYKNNVATGITKPNTSSDKDYIAPVITTGCLNILSNLGTGIDDTNKQYTSILTCNNQIGADKAAFGAAAKIDYVVSGNNSLCYIKRGNDYALAGKTFTYYSMVQLNGSYYKIVQINPDSSWQYHYYNNNTLALVPTAWLGYNATATCALNAGVKTGYLHYADIYEVYADNNFKIAVSQGVYVPNGTGGNTVADVLSDKCQSGDTDNGSIIDLLYSELSTKITNSELIPNQKYRITDFRTATEFRSQEDPTTPIILQGTIEPLIVTAISTGTLSPIAVSPDYVTDIIHYVWDNTKKNPLYAGSTHGTIIKRIDTFNNNEFDFDCRGLRSGISDRLLLNGNNWVISPDVFMQNCKIELAMNDSLDTQSLVDVAQGSSVIFESGDFLSSTIKIGVGVAVIFSSGTDERLLIKNSNLTISENYVRAYNYVSGTPTQSTYTNDNFFVLSLVNSNITSTVFYVGTTLGGLLAKWNVLYGTSFNGLVFSTWRTPADDEDFENMFNNSVQVMCMVDTIDTIPLTTYKGICVGKFIQYNGTFFEQTILL